MKTAALELARASRSVRRAFVETPPSIVMTYPEQESPSGTVS